MPPPGSLTRYAAPLAIAVAWALSLVLPAISVAGGPTYDGLDLLLRGWQGMSRDVFAWLANPLFVAAVLLSLLRRNLAATVLSLGALVLGASSFATEDLLSRRMNSVPDLTFRIGFYLWLVALAALCLRSLTLLRRSRRRESAS